MIYYDSSDFYSYSRRRRKIVNIEILSTGYVRISCEDFTRHWGWAQMPKREWDKLKTGEKIPDKYIFENECKSAMPILTK